MAARLVRPDGRLDARLVLIGEAGGYHEGVKGRPFVGPSGGLLSRWWAQVGLRRQDLYIDNVYPYQPPGNDLSRVDPEELKGHVAQLHVRLSKLVDPWLIVPTGNVALEALTGKTGITKWRGSLLTYDAHGRTVKVIPTIHPAATFRDPSYTRLCQADWARIAADQHFRELRLPQREHWTRPTLADVEAFVAEALKAPRVALDIETPRSVSETQVGVYKNGRPRFSKVIGEPRCVCVGLSYRPDLSLTVPTTKSYWGSVKRLEQVWAVLRRLCEAPVEKVLQNGLFDTFYLKLDHGIELTNWRWDTKAMHHALEPLAEHDLATMASLETRQPYWKDEAKDPDEIAKYASSIDALWTYCGIDAAVTLELCDVFEQQLRDAKRLRFYERHYAALFQPLCALMTEGIHVDEARRRRRLATLTARCITIQDRLTALAGEPLYGKKDLSGVKLKRFLYETLKLPQQYTKNAKREPTVTVREIAVRKLMLRYPDKLGEAGSLILEHRRAAKLASFYADTTVDADGRVRTQYGYAVTGRLTSSKNPKRRGMNLQNVDREARDHFVPDEGHIWLEVDYSQIEKRIVDCLTGDAELVRQAQTPPWEWDAHCHNATIIFGRKITKKDKVERYIGKRAVHASNYGMQGTTLSEVLLKDGFTYTPDECQRMVDAYLAGNPAIVAWHRRTRQEIIQTRCVTGLFGDLWDLRFYRLNDETFRLGYALRPQNGCARALNEGFARLWRALRAGGFEARIRTHVHDSLGISTPPAEAWDVWQLSRWALERPITVAGVKLVVPLELKLGTSQAAHVEFEQPPLREEFSVALATLRSEGEPPGPVASVVV